MAIVKLHYEGDLRRVKVPTFRGLSFERLVEIIKETFASLPPSIRVGYVDDEGDFISVRTDPDVQTALESWRLGMPPFRFEILDSSNCSGAFLSCSVSLADYAQQAAADRGDQLSARLQNVNICQICKLATVAGARYSCSICKDFIICGSCEATSEIALAHRGMHTIKKVPIPSLTAADCAQEHYSCSAESTCAQTLLTPISGLQSLVCAVKELTFPNHTTLPPDTRFIKTWLIQNTGREPWPCEVILRRVEQPQHLLVVDDCVSLKRLLPGEESRLSISLQSGSSFGEAVGKWRLHTQTGEQVGPLLEVNITIDPASCPVLTTSLVFGQAVPPPPLMATALPVKDEDSLPSSMSSMSSIPCATVDSIHVTLTDGEVLQAEGLGRTIKTSISVDADQVPEERKESAAQFHVQPEVGHQLTIEAKWSAELEELSRMGFNSRSQNLKYLEEFDGDVKLVLDHLLCPSDFLDIQEVESEKEKESCPRPLSPPRNDSASMPASATDSNSKDSDAESVVERQRHITSQSEQQLEAKSPIEEKDEEYLNQEAWGAELQILGSMGFTDRSQCVKLLEAHSGVLHEVVNEILNSY